VSVFSFSYGNRFVFADMLVSKSSINCIFILLYLCISVKNN